jgi:hypothetical protein
MRLQVVPLERIKVGEYYTLIERFDDQLYISFAKIRRITRNYIFFNEVYLDDNGLRFDSYVSWLDKKHIIKKNALMVRGIKEELQALINEYKERVKKWHEERRNQLGKIYLTLHDECERRIKTWETNNPLPENPLAKYFE